jgi:hypothetical protein
MRSPHWAQRLEPRVLLAAISWDGGGDGVHWDQPNNWSPNQVPTINDDVTIDVPAANPTITIRTNAAVRSLTTRETIYLSFPGQFVEFRAAGDVNLFADFRIENLATGGTWNGPGRIVILNNAALLNQPGTINCDIVFDDHGTTFSIQGDLVFNGTMVLGATGSNLSDQVFLSGEAARSITGTGTFIFRGNDSIFSSSINNNTVNPPNSLTIGPDIKLIAEGTGRIQNNYFGNSTIFNGTIEVTTPGSVFVINHRVDNQGTVHVSNGGVFGMFLDDQSVIGSIDLQSGGGVVLQSGRQVLGDPFTFNVNSPITVPQGASLALSGQFNLNADLDVSGDLILEYTGSSHLGLARQKLTSGYAGGAWNGPGIRSSRAAANPGFALGYGEASEILGPGGGIFGPFLIDSTAVLVRSTRYGDANLDGNVNLADFNVLAAQFGQTGVPAWNRGDFNFDQRVNLADFNLLAGQFGQTASVAEGGDDPFDLLG